LIYFSTVAGALAPVRLKSLPLARLAIAFLTLSIVSVFWSVYKSETLNASYGAIVFLTLFVLLVKTTHTRRDVERLMMGLAVAGVTLSLGVVVGYHGGRASLMGTNANDLAYALVTLVPIVLALRGKGWGLRRVLISMLVLVMCMSTLLTASRGGAVGLMVVLFAASVFPLDVARNGWLKRRNIAAAVVALGFAAVLGTVMFGFLPQDTQERLLTLIHPEQDYNTSTDINASRRVIWMRDLRLAIERPIGYGAATAVFVDGKYGQHLGHWVTAHNSVIQAFLELGLLGMYLYLATFYVALRDLGRISGARPRDGPTPEAARAALYARALRIALLGNFTSGFFLSQAYSPTLWMLIALCCAFTRIEAVNASSGERQPAPAAARRRLRRLRSPA